MKKKTLIIIAVTGVLAAAAAVSVFWFGKEKRDREAEAASLEALFLRDGTGETVGNYLFVDTRNGTPFTGPLPEGAVLDEVCKNRFRTVFDVNQYVMKYWQYMEGKFTPQSPKLGRFYTIGKHDQQIHHTIRRQACKMICLNDDVNVGDFEKQKKEIQRSFEVIFPEKSSFEM